MRYLASLLLLNAWLLTSCEPPPEPNTESRNESCWPALLDAHSKVYFEFDQGEPSAEAIAAARAVLGERLRSCGPEDSYYATPEDITTGNAAIVSLFDMAIIADDPEQVRRYAGGDPVETNEKPEVDSLLYAEQFIQLGAYFESRNALRALGAMGHNPRIADEVGATPLHVVNAYTSAGLRLIKDFASAGLDVNAATERDITPMMTARLRGDLVKAQCLYALGGRIPDMVELAPWTIEPHRETAVAAVDAFFLAGEREVPVRVLEVCLAK